MIQFPYKSAFSRFLFFVLLFIGSSTLSAQNVTETRWYFGNSVENLVFDRNGRDVYLQTDQAIPFGAAGAATITDQFTGNLLFYTDGINVYDASYSIVPNGAGLSGVSSVNVPVVTCPVTDNPGQYYLFTNSGPGGVNEIQYTIVDATIQGNGSAQFPYGDVIAGMSDVSIGLSDPSEGMLIIPAGDGELFWLISQNRNTFEIQVTQVDAGGVGATTNYNFTNATTPGFEASHFAFNADSSKLAMVPRRSNRNIWMMNFDPASGVLTFDQTLIGTGFNDDQGESIYDAEWSGDGSKLYFSRFGSSGTTGQLYQIDFNDTTQTVNSILPTPIFRSYGLKRAPDNRIYHLYQETNASAFNLGRINQPDSIADSVQYQRLVFPDDFNARQFSEHTPAYNFTFDTLGFYWIDSCETNITKFFPIVEPVPNNLFWSFGDGGGSNAWIPNYQYQAAGGYMVSLTAEVNGITQTITQPVEILTNDLMVDLGNDTTICVDEILTLDAGTGTSFVWSTGETTQTIEVDTAGTYWVEVTNAAGCTGFDDKEVTEYGIANQTSNQWYFGEQAGIEFTNGPIAILDGNQQDALEGCATISDVNGDLLFYTNGFTVWNKEHDVMVNGDTIGGEQRSAQNSLIMPFADDQTMFYIFTTERVYGDDEYALRYSIVDMKEDAARGKVIVKNVKLMENSTERITGSGFTGNDLIVAHEFGNNTFRAYQTGAPGLSGAIFSPAGEIHDFMQELSATGYMKISPTLNQIAVNIPGTNQVEILDFDQGEVSNPRLIDTGESNLYGMEFSPGGLKLYLTTSSGASKLIQYDLDSLNSMDPVADISATKFDGYTQGADYGALQLGPNGTIYMAIDNSGTIGTIDAPDGDDAGAAFNQSGFDLAGRTSRLGLPNFAQNQTPPLQQPSMTVTEGCAGQPSTFSAVGRDPNNQIENYLWIFGDGTSAAVQDTTHIYDSPGTYTVQLMLSNRCDTDTTMTQTITINNLPESPTVPTDTALCDQPIVLTAWPMNNPDFSYYWSTGDTSRQITVNSAAIIDVAIINNVTGCTSDTLQVFLADARPAVDLGPDRSLCQNDPTITFDAQVTRATYEWAIDGVVMGNNRTFDVDTTTVGVFEYTVAVTNSFGCIGRDTVQVTIQPQPDVTVNPNATTGCGNDDGTVDLTFNTAGSYSYQLSGPSNFGPANFDGPGTAPTITGLSPGNYSLVATNLVTNCDYLEIVQIEDPGSFNMSVFSTGNCDNQVELTISGTTPTLPASYDYEVQDSNGIIVSSGTGSVDPLVIAGLDPGTLSIQVTDNNPPNCVETEQITIMPGNEPAFTFDAIQEICGTSGRVGISDGGTAGVSYAWTTVDGNITSTATGDSIDVDMPGTYTVTATAPGFCDRSEDIRVDFNATPTLAVNVEGDPCEGQVTLVAEITGGSGSYIYNWNDGSQAMRNTVTASGTYNVTVLDQFTGCEITSGNTDVEIQTEFTVTLSLNPDCDNNQNVHVIATTNYYNPSVTYEWQDGNGNVLADTDSILTVTQSDRYTITATNENGTCMATDALDVAVIPINPEDLLLPERATFCTGNANNPTVDLDPGIFNTYEWRLLPDDAIISTDPVLTVSTAGTYEVTIYNGFTCVTDRVEVVEDCRPVIFAPNAFSPNGNGVNEEFFVFPNDYIDTFEILIYTRWGELVYTSNNQDFRWNGIYRGALLPPGTYAYILKFSSSLAPDLGTIEQYGSVTLIR
ncbi:gliding motility-associated C-terminal domain-containing protein [Ekhidna lutea]|uniref:Gliding motility-associated C-terminal domain-containing protein n=2 Tax=Ekhidna lutea TaxID=447679 RepID=A0A239M157_EKHLU|nr:gliding motility-associated C-terminal domain-containing protein [Ekhidna lutea]